MSRRRRIPRRLAARTTRSAGAPASACHPGARGCPAVLPGPARRYRPWRRLRPAGRVASGPRSSSPARPVALRAGALRWPASPPDRAARGALSPFGRPRRSGLRARTPCGPCGPRALARRQHQCGGRAQRHLNSHGLPPWGTLAWRMSPIGVGAHLRCAPRESLHERSLMSLVPFGAGRCRTNQQVARTDVVIAGGGFAGLSLAIALRQGLGPPSRSLLPIRPSRRMRSRRARIRDRGGGAAHVRDDRRVGRGRRRSAADPRHGGHRLQAEDAVRPMFLTFAGEVEPGEPFAHMVENAALVAALVAKARAEASSCARRR